MRYDIGDRVEMLGYAKGALATVIYIDGLDGYGVRTDNMSGGHDCAGSCPPGYGWWVSIHEIKPAAETPFALLVRDYVRRELCGS